MILKKNRMLFPYDGIPHTWWLRNSGTSTIINAPRVLEHFSGLEEGEFMYRILHVYCVWFYFAQDAHTKRFYVWSASHSMIPALLSTLSTHPIACCNIHYLMHTVSHDVCIAYYLQNQTLCLPASFLILPPLCQGHNVERSLGPKCFRQNILAP